MSFLEVKKIYKSFGKTEVLKGIDFSMEKGEVLAIIGSSGSGKTTLLRCMNFLETPDTGTISVNGNVLFSSDEPPYSDAEKREKRLHFGLVFQQFNLFPQYNVLKNVSLAPELRQLKAKKVTKAEKKEIIRQIDDNSRRLLDTVGLSEKVNNYPCELSGEVLRVIRELKTSDRTMIVVTHEMNFARGVADKVIFMADGVIEEYGTPDEVFGTPKSEKTKSFLEKSLENP